MAKTIGIDLGTTNSCIAVLEGGEPTVIPNAEGGRITPSVVAFTKDGQRLVGAPARRQQVTNPLSTIFSIKRFMGRKYDGLEKETDHVILVFDLGGGTFDVSVLELAEGVFEVKATNGDNHLGGDNFDKAVVDWMVSEFKKDQGIDLSQDRMALQRLYEAAEKAKIELSSTMTTQINLPFITATQEGPKHLDLQLTRAKLNELTAEDNHPSVEVHVLQGESEMALYNKTLGKFQLVGIPPAPRGMPQIEVAFDIDANGIINVSAKDMGTGNEQQIRIEGGSGLKEEEVQQMIREAEAHAEEAHKLRELADARNLAETLAYQTERSLKEHRDKLPEADASTIEGRIMELRGVLDSSDVNEIRQKTEALQEASQKLAEAVYAQATAQQAAAAPGPDGAAASDDEEVIEDAEI